MTSVSIVEVQGNQSVDCSLVFSPTQVRFWPCAFLNRENKKIQYNELKIM